WFLGQECGHAIADILLGYQNPSGALPQSFPKCIQDNPTYLNYPGENGDVRYGEGIFVGYRYYQSKGVDPLFAFGHGLSYSQFVYSKLKLSHTSLKACEALSVQLELSNAGKHAGYETVQLYVHDPVSRLIRPEQELKAFQKVWLEAGETKTVVLELQEAAFSYYDPTQGGWLSESGAFELRVGRASDDIRLTATVQLDNPLDTLSLDKSTPLHVGLPIAQLIARADSKQILMTYLGDIVAAPTMLFAMDKSLEAFANENTHLIYPRLLGQVNAELATLTA
ncbi:MAG: fibronectin type III-like domain-contianing protein, partial [Deinococcota bacterium]